MNIIVFYSRKCELSKRLIDLIKEKNIEQYCSFLTIEENLNIVKKYITEYPAIICKYINRILYGDDALEWINNWSNNKKYFDQITNNVHKNNVINPTIKSVFEDIEYNKKEIQSFSDHYTIIEDKNIDKSLLNYNNIETDTITKNKSLNNTVHDKKLNDTEHKKALKIETENRKKLFLAKVNRTSIIK